MIRFTPTIFRTIGRFAGRIRTMRTEIRTERFLNSLPPELRKDIGWPDACEGRRAGR